MVSERSHSSGFRNDGRTPHVYRVFFILGERAMLVSVVDIPRGAMCIGWATQRNDGVPSLQFTTARPPRDSPPWRMATFWWALHSVSVDGNLKATRGSDCRSRVKRGLGSVQSLSSATLSWLRPRRAACSSQTTTAAGGHLAMTGWPRDDSVGWLSHPMVTYTSRPSRPAYRAAIV
jgi:hypothetical protein